MTATLRVVPLFETLDDLNSASKVMDLLLSTPWYRSHVAEVHNNHQEVCPPSPQLKEEETKAELGRRICRGRSSLIRNSKFQVKQRYGVSDVKCRGFTK